MPDIIEFLKIISLLKAGNVRFVVIGGVAMRLHGSAHITDDIDVCYGRTPEDLANLEVTLAPYHVRLRNAPADLPFLFDRRTLANTLNFTLTTDLGDVDILGEVPGVGSFETLWERSVEMELEGEAVRVASLDDLIAMKRAANRPKDQNHIMELLALRKLLLEMNNGS